MSCGDARSVPENVSTTLDPDGRRVNLTRERWGHIVDRHPILAPWVRGVTVAVREPALHTPGRDETEEWYFSDDALPRRWIQVVVHYEGGEGWIVTAFPCHPPRRR